MRLLRRVLSTLVLALAMLTLSVSVSFAQGPLGTAFTYQGRLTDGGGAANGTYDFQFKLFSAASGGTQIGGTQTKDNVNVASGAFVVQLDFGASAFNGQTRYLQIEVRPGASTGAYTTLNPRQVLNATPYALFASAPWATNGSNVSLSQGNVGIGTTAPGAVLSVVKSGATEPSVLGYPTALKIGSPSGTIPLALRQNAPESGTPALAFFETSDGHLGGIGAKINALVINAATDKYLSFHVNGSTEAMRILNTGVDVTVGDLEVEDGDLLVPNGSLGVGIFNPSAKLHVVGTNTVDEVMRVVNPNGQGLWVNGQGNVGVTNLYGTSSTSHVCKSGSLAAFNALAVCGSAAEYVPTIDVGQGFPETADLVSIAASVANPYGDTHGPFAVQKSTSACDTNLLGFIVKPESGADGPKLNDHYLPLAIYGYFPAKVTTENGNIQRGDPLTSSSKPGYAMKATEACKIIGHALEDANVEGTIQVFANTSDNSAPEVARLRKQMQEKDAQIAELNQRLAKLEQVVSGEGGTTTAFNTNWLVVGGVVLTGMILVYRSRNEK